MARAERSLESKNTPGAAAPLRGVGRNDKRTGENLCLVASRDREDEIM